MDERNMNDQNNMTYGDAIAAGYMNGDLKWERGYVSRKCDPMKQEVYLAGGSRKGELFVLLPSWKSSLYSYRQYLVPPRD